MLQQIDGKDVYVVILETMPRLPVRGTGWTRLYAEALTKAIETGVITKPGTYGIVLKEGNTKWDVYELVED